MRINKYISLHTEHSRRKADELIMNGKVKVNGKLCKELGTQIDTDKDKVAVLGKNIEPKDEKIYIALNKPQGYTTTRKDPYNKKTVMDLLPPIPNIKPAGRLDKNTEGLLIFSNDGDYINRITHPKFEHKKEYFAIINGPLTDEEKNRLEKGIFIDKKRTSPAKIKILKRNSNSTELKIEIHEGFNRQIRKMFDYFDHSVKYLQRTKIGNIHLGALKKGKFKYLSKKEINDY